MPTPKWSGGCIATAFLVSLVAVGLVVAAGFVLASLFTS